MTHWVRLEDEVYDRIRAHKRDDESFSDAVDRLTDSRSLRDLRDVFDDDQVTQMRDVIAATERAGRQRDR
ncbi:hypothetical protein CHINAEXTREME_14145 [Halobiforma lacisalsi AJ5]|uniref:Antitoxin n=1 Tax=Natronobacterium lacisalsi AJ5 TaxID=358396 RepID=M0LFM4_NATLA|nr:antitoxin VapB family protein [Halobiforma lacisalsi]APW98854.1 hypothetical protein CHINAEXTREME_14145 [Halobiforma lacisalsi AJ5]EMA32351.1 hypothetical protein C445_11487 [Halobiforma lacisalsi AJ5]